MQKQIQQVREFHNAFKIPVYEYPAIPTMDRCELRHSILQEEVTELNDACKENNIVEAADAIVDCIYVLLGTAHELGLSNILEELFDEVQRSNMSKLDENGNPIYREDGKVMKSSLYFKPDLKSIVDRNLENKN